MEIKNILSAKETIHKMMPFIKGISNPPEASSYMDELSTNLKMVSSGANDLVNPAAKELIFQFKDLHSLISTINEKLTEELRLYNDKKENLDGLNEWEKKRYDFLNTISKPIFYFIEMVKSTPWGPFLKYEHLSSPGPLFSPKEHWPKKLQGVHVGLRTVLLERNDVVEPLLVLYGSMKEAQATLGAYYGLEFKTIEGGFTAAHALLKLNPNELSPQRKKQLLDVKSWLEREGYLEIAKSVKI